MYGADKVLLDLITGIDKSKYKILVILPSYGILYERLIKENVDVKVINYPVIRRKYFNIHGFYQYIKEYFFSKKKLISISKEFRPDIIHINTIAVLEGIYLKKSLNSKLIWHIHEILEKPKIIVSILYNMVLKNSDRIIAVSKAVSDEIKKHGNEYNNSKIRIIYNGVNNNEYNPNNDTLYLKKEFNISNDSIVVGMLGRVNAWKGQKDFLKALDIVLRRNKNVIGILVGGTFSGQEWRIGELREEIKSLENSDRIIMCNYRNDSKNIENLFDMFILPSTKKDPLPTVVLESMASGKPIIGYNHGGISEMVIDGKNGFLVEPLNYKELAEKINILLENSSLRKKMGIESLKRQKKYFSINSYIDNIEKIYKEVTI